MLFSAGKGTGGAPGDPHGARFTDVYRAYAPVVRDFVLSREPGLDRADLPNVVQEVFVRLWENMQSFRGDSSVKTYVLGIALNVLREERRARRRRSALPFDDVKDEVTGRWGGDDRTLEAEEAAVAIERAKMQLTPEQREAFELVHILHVPIHEATVLTGCNANQFRNRLYRARRTLRRLLWGLIPFLLWVAFVPV